MNLTLWRLKLRKVNEAASYVGLWLAGGIGAALFLSYGITAKTLGVMFGLALWSFAGYYAGVPAWERIRGWHFGRGDIMPVVVMMLLLPLFFIAFWLEETGERLRLRNPEHEHRNRQLNVAGLLDIVLVGWILGTGVILQLEPGWFIVAIMAGPLLLVSAWWLYQRFRQRYSDFVTNHRWNQVANHLLGSLALAVAGAAVLALALLNA